MTDVEFDVCGPLPRGVTVLEASAGTGKTFTIAALAARYVAAGTPLEHLLLVTFTRMATSELRERVRERLVSAEHGLGRALAGDVLPAHDEVLALLATGDPAEVDRRRRLLAVALADFDAATISTTHGFCQHTLSGLGVAGDVEAGTVLVEDASDLVEEVVDDLYVRRFHRHDLPPFDRAEALEIARVAVSNSQARIGPEVKDRTSDGAMRQRLAQAVRDEVEHRKRRLGILTYDDLLTRLAETLRDPVRGPAACARLRDQYRVALVDEFQDTDPVQWEIMRRAFGDGDGDGGTLVLIGDPKQAIYAFRGADVHAYLDAASKAGTRATLGVNWRSDQGLIDAYDALLGGTRLGHEGIRYRRVRAAPANQEPRLVGGSCTKPLRVRIAHRSDGLVSLTPQGWASNKSGREHIAADLAADVVRLLSSGAQVISRDAAGAETGRERVSPGHLAVLVRTNANASLVRDALDAVDVPAVVGGAGSVLATPVGREWLTLLEALERPSASTRVRAAALTCFVGWDARRVATADESAWEELHARFHRWASVLRRSGVTALTELVTHDEALPHRLLGQLDGERRLTDLRHVGQLLHAEATAAELGPSALAAWLRHRLEEARGDDGSEERSRRLESDAEAVQVLTIHRSKGLEFPIVYFPYLWDPGYWAERGPQVFHDPASGDERTIDVTMEGSAFARHKRLALEEQRGEDLRLAYVALTRARHQAVLWWASSHDSRHSPLGRLLFARSGGVVPAEGSTGPADDAVSDRMESLAAEAPGRISVERTTGGNGARGVAGRPLAAALGVRGFGRRLDTEWRRTSYTGITADLHEAVVTSEPESTGVIDEDPVETSLATPPDGDGDGDADTGDERRLQAVPLPLAAMRRGTEVGTMVHAVFESADFTAIDLASELDGRIAGQAWRRVDLGNPVEVLAGLRAVIETPLGPMVDELRLRDVGATDRLDELGFELPLVGGDDPTATLTLEAIASLLRSQLPAGDVLHGYADRLGDPALASALRGYLVGSIDLVVRVPSRGGPRFTVIDYKTNWLGDGENLTAWHHRPPALADAMQRAHYPLQALLYSVALHRYLRWRLPTYDPERHLGAVLYLFVRGMTGAAVPRVDGHPCGVFAWQPPPTLVADLSDLFDRGPTAP